MKLAIPYSWERAMQAVRQHSSAAGAEQVECWMVQGMVAAQMEDGFGEVAVVEVDADLTSEALLEALRSEAQAEVGGEMEGRVVDWWQRNGNMLMWEEAQEEARVCLTEQWVAVRMGGA